MDNPTAYDPSLLSQQSKASSDGEAGIFGPNTSAVRDFVDRRIGNAASDSMALDWWASQPTSYWREWPPERQTEWKKAFQNAQASAKAADRSKEWKRARKQAKSAAYDAGLRGGSRLVRAFHIAAADFASALVVADLGVSALLLEPFESLEYGPNFQELRQFLASDIREAAQDLAAVGSWAGRIDRSALEERRTSATRALGAGGTRPGASGQAELAGAAAVAAAMTWADHSSLQKPEIEVLWMALMDKATSIALKPADPMADPLLDQLATPFNILQRVSTGLGDAAWQGVLASMFDSRPVWKQE